MKEIYSWVPWFQELSEKIADSGEADLVERAKRIAWKEDASEPPLLRYGDDNIDPFSFIYTLAAAGPYSRSRKRVYESVTEEFDLSSPLALDTDEAFIFPTPQPNATLFHQRGGGDPGLLWSLFRNATQGVESISAEEFDAALQIKFVAITKLSQALFLIRPDEFLPYDSILSLGLAEPTRPQDVDWAGYAAELGKYCDAFPGCMPYEMNLLAYEARRSKGALKVDPAVCYQISTTPTTMT